MTTKELLDKVLSLPVDERARIADSILRSLTAPQPEIRSIVDGRSPGDICQRPSAPSASPFSDSSRTK